ncbi:MAG: AAA family ATPase [Candidatus Pacebacteria bacterium]|nr:AAA family ATPase [Candidatus Paceibacterota bacterium]MDR3583010.1 AAA family ATPase [Candidatus Paceibacterota bacterium]
MFKERYLHSAVTGDLREKMVFIGGPRQVGKTTLARQIGEGDYKKYDYLSWDNRQDRKRIIEGQFKADADLLIFDEIHKYRQWKNYLKGEFDQNKDKFNILATGSARMDVYRRGGDSLMGRYHYYRLHPFTLAEASGLAPVLTVLKEPSFVDPDKNHLGKVFSDLFRFGGFPEPFIKKDLMELRRFHNERLDRLVKEDIRDIEQIRDLSALQVLVDILPEKVGSLLSLNSLKEDLLVTHKTVSLWMNVLERFYYHFRIYPFAGSAIRSLRKEPKMYLWDWSQLENEAARFENLIASHLLKVAHYFYDRQGHKVELFFLRDTDGREVDFLLTVNRKPWLAVEAKMTASENSNHLGYFSTRLKIPFSYQVIKESGVDYLKDAVRFISADKFLSGLM